MGGVKAAAWTLPAVVVFSALVALRSRESPSTLNLSSGRLGHVVTVNNVTKMTWAASDPVAARDFFLKYLPSSEASDGCSPRCKCGIQGRVTLDGTSAFGLHSTFDAEHPTGPLNLSHVETIFSTKVGGLERYVDVLDHHVGLYWSSLDSLVASLDAHDRPFLALSWTSVDGLSMLSIIVHVPQSQIIFEVVGPLAPSISIPSFNSTT